MNVKDHHIIQRQSVEIIFNDLDDGMGMQNHIAEVFYEKVQPKMELLFDELFGRNYYASVDRLEIDCGLLDKKNWEDEFIGQALRKLKEQLVQVNKKEYNYKENQEANATKTFLFFLENGFLPWNSRVESLEQLEAQVIIDKRLITELKKIILQQPKIAERLIQQFSKKFISKIVERLIKDEKLANALPAVIEELRPYQIDKDKIDIAVLTAFAFYQNESFRQSVINVLIKNVHKQELKQELKSLVSNIQEEMNKPGIKKEEKPKQKKIDEVIYINNAGLILLHPFLPILFEHLNVTKENKWIDTSSQNKAVVLLEFLATGNSQFAEFSLMLNKVLCGIEIDEVITTVDDLADEEKNECEALLRNLITHWNVLKNTSIDGLREAFIQRNGKLSKVSNGWLLQVEQKSIDVLLGHLPWGIGLIKLPWMNEMLFTEWA